MDAERRGAGLGTALTERICDGLEAAGCRTLALVATEQGRPLYERMGFEIVDWYVTVEREAPAPATDGAGGGAVVGDRSLSPFGPADVAEAAALDRAATGEDREHLLAAFAAIPGGLALRDAAGALRAFVVRAPWGGGGDDRARPRRRAAHPRGTPRGRAGRPPRSRRELLSNAAGLAVLDAEGWTEAWRAPRLHRGEPLAWHPAAIWGQFNHAIG